MTRWSIGDVGSEGAEWATHICAWPVSIRNRIIRKKTDFAPNAVPIQDGPGFNFDAALPESVMLELMVEAARNGIRVGSFTDNILDLYEIVDKQAPIGDQRWLIEHIGRYSPEEIARIRDLGLVLQAYSNRWIYQEGEALRREYGADQVDRILPMRDLLNAGIHVSRDRQCAADPFHPIWHVVSRMTEETGERLGEAQALTRMEALCLCVP